jgi:hypothetical protein
MRMRVAFALTSIARPLSSYALLRLSASALVGVPGVPTIRSCRGEFAKLVPYHLLGDIDRHMLAAIVNRDCVANHAWKDRGCARPCAHYRSLVAGIEDIDLFLKLQIDVWALLGRS